MNSFWLIHVIAWKPSVRCLLPFFYTPARLQQTANMSWCNKYRECIWLLMCQRMLTTTVDVGWRNLVVVDVSRWFIELCNTTQTNKKLNTVDQCGRIRFPLTKHYNQKHFSVESINADGGVHVYRHANEIRLVNLLLSLEFVLMMKFHCLLIQVTCSFPLCFQPVWLSDTTLIVFSCSPCIYGLIPISHTLLFIFIYPKCKDLSLRKKSTMKSGVSLWEMGTASSHTKHEDLVSD